VPRVVMICDDDVRRNAIQQRWYYEETGVYSNEEEAEIKVSVFSLTLFRV